VVGEKWNLQILVNLLVINVARYVSRSAETLEVYQLQVPEVGVGSVSSDTARIVHFLHRINRLLCTTDMGCVYRARYRLDL
jgi:hypothetical protein